jgi:hypothetical protein
MKKKLLICLFFMATQFARAQKDSLPVTKTETQSSGSYHFSSSFKKSKTKPVIAYLEKELGNAHSSNNNRYSWKSIGLPLNKADITRVLLRPGYVEMSWSNTANPPNATAIIQQLEKLAAQIATITKDD